jgi:hypothetical protein
MELNNFASHVTNVLIGHYRALEWKEKEQKYVEDPNLGIIVEVEVRTTPS